MTRYAMGLLGVLAFSGLALAGPADMFEEKEKDFGVSPKGTILVHYFRFTNNTKQTVTLGQPRVSCGCVTPAFGMLRVSIYAITAPVSPGASWFLVSAGVTHPQDTRGCPSVTVSLVLFVNRK